MAMPPIGWRDRVIASFHAVKLSADYLPSSEVLLTLYENGFKNKLQECFYKYNPRTEFILSGNL